jgi:hypothetical protein
MYIAQTRQGAEIDPKLKFTEFTLRLSVAAARYISEPKIVLWFTGQLDGYSRKRLPFIGNHPGAS